MIKNTFEIWSTPFGESGLPYFSITHNHSNYHFYYDENRNPKVHINKHSVDDR